MTPLQRLVFYPTMAVMYLLIAAFCWIGLVIAIAAYPIVGEQITRAIESSDARHLAQLAQTDPDLAAWLVAQRDRRIDV